MDTKPIGKENLVTLGAMAHVWTKSGQSSELSSTFDSGSALCLFAVVGAAIFRQCIDALERLDAAIRAERERPGPIAESAAIWRMVRGSRNG